MNNFPYNCVLCNYVTSDETPTRSRTPGWIMREKKRDREIIRYAFCPIMVKGSVHCMSASRDVDHI